MPDVSSISSRPSLQTFRERKLELPNTGPEEPTSESEKDQEITKLRQNFQKVQQKAQLILSEARNLAIVRRVPVDQDDIDVRAAVIRQDEGSGGLFISFELYERSLVYLRKQRESLPPTILDELSGDLFSDSRRVQTQLLAEQENTTQDQAKLLASHIVILAVLKLLQMGLDNLDTGKQTATKSPSAAELGPLFAGIAISIAAQQLYAGLTDKEIKKSLESVAGEPVPAQELSAAKKALSENELFQAALKSRRPSDYQIIVNYVDAFLNRQIEPGWETWQSIGLLDEMVSWTGSSAVHLERYERAEGSEQSAENRNYLSPIITQAIVIERTEGSPRFDGMTTRLFERKLDSLNRTVDKIGHVLGYALKSQDLCCFLRWLNQMPSKDSIRGIRNFLITIQRFVAIVDNYGASARYRGHLALSANIHQAALLMLQDIKQGFIKKMRHWLLVADERWGELMKCQLIDDLYTYMVSGISQVENTLVSLLDRYLGYIEDQEKRADSTIDAMAQQRDIRFLIAIIDKFLELTESAEALCPEEDATELAAQASRVMNSVGGGILLPLGGDPYSTISSPPVTLSTGKQIPAAQFKESEEDIVTSAERACMDHEIDMNIVPFPRA